MSRKHCIRAAIGRLMTCALPSVERVTIVQHCPEPWRAMAAQLDSVVSVLLGPPTTFAAIPSLDRKQRRKACPTVQ